MSARSKEWFYVVRVKGAWKTWFPSETKGFPGWSVAGVLLGGISKTEWVYCIASDYFLLDSVELPKRSKALFMQLAIPPS